MAVHRGRERSENGRFLCGTRRSERAHCGYGVFIHWYQVTRFRPLEPAPVSGPDSIPIKMPPPPPPLSPLERRRRRRGEDRLREKEREKRKKKEEKIKNRPVYLFADTGCRAIPTGLMPYPSPPLFFMSKRPAPSSLPILKPIACE